MKANEQLLMTIGEIDSRYILAAEGPASVQTVLAPARRPARGWLWGLVPVAAALGLVVYLGGVGGNAGYVQPDALTRGVDVAVLHDGEALPVVPAPSAVAPGAVPESAVETLWDFVSPIGLWGIAPDTVQFYENGDVVDLLTDELFAWNSDGTLAGSELYSSWHIVDDVLILTTHDGHDVEFIRN